MRARAYGLGGGIRHPLRNGFTAYAVLSPATNSSCHRRRRMSGCPARSGLGEPPPTWHQQRVSGPHGFAVRSNVVRPARLDIAHGVQPALRHQRRADALASTTSRPAFVTTRDRPSCRNGTGRIRPLILARGEADFCPSCQSAATRRASAYPVGPLRVIRTLGEPKRPHLASDIVTPVSDGKRVVEAPRTRYR